MEACLQQRRHFSFFVISVYALLWAEAEATLKRLASRQVEATLLLHMRLHE